MFDVTLTDREFVENFVHKDADWLKSTKTNEPDLEIDGLNGSLLFRIFSIFRRSS